MTRTTTYVVDVQFGDCDPAGIVFFPNFSRWMDAASLDFFRQCGLPPWRDLEASRQIMGTPLLEIHTRFVKSATYGERLGIDTRIEEWQNKAFVMSHRVTRGDDLICEGKETRIFIRRDAERGMRAIAVPEDIKAMCS